MMRIRLSARYEWEAQDSPPFFDRTFQDSRITIGNDPAASLCLNGSVLSPEQIVILDSGTETLVINQAEGATLNGETLALNAQCSLRDGDVLRIGTYKISIFLDAESPIQEGATPISNSETQISDEAVLMADERSLSGVNWSAPSLLGEEVVELLVEEAPDSATSLQPKNETTGAFAGAIDQTKPTKSFAAILDSLRTDEDRFYFVIEGGEQAGVRVPIELEQMPVGWDETGRRLSFDVSSIAGIHAIARKDWSGVILQPQTPGIAVNNEPLEGERRLRDGDRVALTKLDGQTNHESPVVLIFREPTSLVILDSLMPGLLPLRENGGAAVVENGNSASAERTHDRKPFLKLSTIMKSDREYFGAFTFVELSLMAIGTIVGAVIIFLILNYS